MKKFIVIFTCMLMAVVSPAQELPTLETYSLKNGLAVYLIKYGKIEAMNINLVINSGKKNEVPGQQGYNALVAEMVLRGNTVYTEEQQNDSAFAMGTGINPSSGFDYTTLSANLLSRHAKPMFAMMSAAVIHPLFDKEKVEQAISYLSSYNTPSKMDVTAMARIYSNMVVHGLENPLGRSITKQQLKTITPEKLITFHQFNYTPKNTRIIVCGNYNSNEVKKLIDSCFGAWQSVYGEVNGVSLDVPEIKKKEYYFVNRTGATQCALNWTKNGPGRREKDALAFTIANQIFNQVLFREIREKGGKTYGISSILNNSAFSNLLQIECSVRNEVLLSTIQLFDKTLTNFATGNFTQDDFDTEIARFKTNMLAKEFPEEVVSFYNPLLYDFKTRKNILNELTKLTPDDIRKVIKKYYNPESYKLVIAGNQASVAEQLTQLPLLKTLSPADLELATGK